MHNLEIRQGRLPDLPELQQLFVETITTVCSADYDGRQIQVWTSSVTNQQRWLDIIHQQYILIAVDQEKIVGFCSLDKGNYVDFLYVHKDYQGQGIAKKLYADIEDEAIRLGKTQLSSDVSKTARPFFEKMGFRVVTEQTVERQGVELTNYKMEKSI